MAVGSRDLTPENLRGFDDERLLEELRKAKEELFNLRFQSATGQLESHGRLKAHDEQNAAGQGDLVRLAETRPLSATKRWRVVEIIQKAK